MHERKATGEGSGRGQPYVRRAELLAAGDVLIAHGHTVKAAADIVGISPTLLRRWRIEAAKGQVFSDNSQKKGSRAAHDK